jgi:hypothetical protein
MVVSTACAAFTCHTGEFHSNDSFVVVVGSQSRTIMWNLEWLLGNVFQPARVPISLGVASLLCSKSVELGHQIMLPRAQGMIITKPWSSCQPDLKKGMASKAWD